MKCVARDGGAHQCTATYSLRVMKVYTWNVLFAVLKLCMTAHRINFELWYLEVLHSRELDNLCLYSEISKILFACKGFIGCDLDFFANYFIGNGKLGKV